MTWHKIDFTQNKGVTMDADYYQNLFDKSGYFEACEKLANALAKYDMTKSETPTVEVYPAISFEEMYAAE